jgi:hypothetical protein
VAFGVSELQELKVRLLIAESDELDVVGPLLSQLQGEKPTTKSFLERIKQDVGEADSSAATGTHQHPAADWPGDSRLKTVSE